MRHALECTGKLQPVQRVGERSSISGDNTHEYCEQSENDDQDANPHNHSLLQPAQGKLIKLHENAHLDQPTALRQCVAGDPIIVNGHTRPAPGNMYFVLILSSYSLQALPDERESTQCAFPSLYESGNGLKCTRRHQPGLLQQSGSPTVSFVVREGNTIDKGALNEVKIAVTGGVIDPHLSITMRIAAARNENVML